MDHSGGSAGQRGRMPAAGQPLPAGLTADQSHGLVRDELVKDPDGVGPAADARQHGIRQPPGSADDLLPRLGSDDPLEVPDHHRERMRAHHRADAVVGAAHRRYPIAEGRVDRVLERPAAGRDRHHLGAEHPHPDHVQRLPLGVFLAHVDDALQAEQRARGRGRYAVLAGARLGNDSRLAHPAGQQRLAEHIVDLVGAGVRKVLALQEYPAAARLGGEPRHLGEQRRPACVVPQQRGELCLESRIGLGREVGSGEFREWRHQRLGGQLTAIRAKMASCVGHRRRPWRYRRMRRAWLLRALPCWRGHGARRGHPRSPRSAGCEPAVTRSATADLGSRPVTRLSPTSTASAPAAA